MTTGHVQPRRELSGVGVVLGAVPQSLDDLTRVAAALVGAKETQPQGSMQRRMWQQRVAARAGVL